MRAKTPLRFELFRGKNKRWYWRLRWYNGRIVADSGVGHGYSTKGNATKAARQLGWAIRHYKVPTVEVEK